MCFPCFLHLTESSLNFSFGKRKSGNRDVFPVLPSVFLLYNVTKTCLPTQLGEESSFSRQTAELKCCVNAISASRYSSVN